MNLGTLWRLVKALNILKSAEQEATSVNPVTIPPKMWYTSMTIVASALGALVVNFTPELQAFISGHPKMASVIAAVTGILLRFKTDRPVA